MSVTESGSSAGKRFSSESLDQLFHGARTHVAWQSQPVSAELLKEVYNLARMGPTSTMVVPHDSCFSPRMQPRSGSCPP